jgi:hypothetical protein
MITLMVPSPRSAWGRTGGAGSLKFGENCSDRDSRLRRSSMLGMWNRSSGCLRNGTSRPLTSVATQLRALEEMDE